MELTQLTNINSIQHSYEVNKNSQPNNSLNIKEIPEQKHSDKIERSIGSDFLSSISSNIVKVANLQKQHSSISTQLEITNEIVKTVDVAVNSSKIQLDDKQPEINTLLNSFNKISKTSKIPEISDKPGIYFDGQVGAKPISSQEIYEDVQEKQERLSSIQQSISKEIESTSNNIKESISIEKTMVETKFEFKNVDFEKESLEFSSDSITNFKGEILSSQANALPLHSEQLLA